MKRFLPALVAVVLILSACTSAPTPTPDRAALQPPAAAIPLPAPRPAGSCHAMGALPDSLCTPGATNSAVTQESIQSTICVSGYTKTIRPLVTYTSPLKAQQMREYGYTDPITAHEEDHLIALEDGGSPSDPANLWPGPYESAGNPLGMHAKDRLENALHAEVCAGQITLVEAQRQLSTNWVAAYNALNAKGALPAGVVYDPSGD